MVGASTHTVPFLILPACFKMHSRKKKKKKMYQAVPSNMWFSPSCKWR